MPILHASGVMMPGQLGPIRRVLRTGQGALHADHVEHRNALGNANDQFHAGVHGLQDGIRGKGRRHVNNGGVGAGGGDRLADRVEHGQVEMLRAALVRCYAADHVRAIGDGLFGMERALGSGEALANYFRVVVDQNRH